MSWSDNNNNNNPWGSQGGGNGRNQGPDIDNIIKDLQNKFKGIIPGSFFGKLGPLVLLVGFILIWLASQIRINPTSRTNGPNLPKNDPGIIPLNLFCKSLIILSISGPWLRPLPPP